MQGIARLVYRKRHDIEFYVRSPIFCVLSARRSAHLARFNGERPAAVYQPFPAHVSQAQWIAHLIIEGVARLEPHNRAGLVVVL